jgi:muramoyltetrapeptide carboxypeptidase
MTSAIKPPRLRPGDTIGIAAPASAFEEEAFHRGIRRIHDAGYRTSFCPDIFSRSGYLAGTDERRADELHRLFADRTISAIFCARGGYGSQRILPLLDAATIRRNPKIFMGYSDITALHTYFQKMCDLVTFHGPLVTELDRMDAGAVSFVFESLGRKSPWGELPACGIEALCPGNAEGELIGGSLSIYSILLGTVYAPLMEEKILFFEDRGEKPYAIDRIFSHLKLAGIFNRINGLILGQFVPPVGWEGEEESYGAEIKRIVLEAALEFNFPVLANFPAGHARRNICFPMGVRVRIDGIKKTVAIVESCLVG